MNLSLETLEILVVALADRQAGEELFNAINNSLPLSEHTLNVLIVAMADEPAALGLAMAIENASIVPKRILDILTVSLSSAEASEQVDEKLEENATPVPPPPVNDNGVEFYAACNACWEEWEGVSELDMLACFDEVESPEESVNVNGDLTCSTPLSAPSVGDWACNCAFVGGCTPAIGGNCEVYS